uniref:Uncharacterized protein n=1 Tax=Caenorhabditis japonica TaxID=281687 RepID=A0A8R1DMU8_CAEJA
MKKDMSKNHARNRLMDCYILGASTYATIVKIPHFSPETPTRKNELQPLVVYSLNKKRRWEISTNFDAEVTEDGVKSILFKRKLKNLSYIWWSLERNDFTTSYYYSKAIDENLMNSAKKEDKLIGYHVIKVQKNFKKLLEHKCVRSFGLKNPDCLGYTTPGLFTELAYELMENEGGEMLPEEHDEEKEEVLESIKKPNGFYKLEEHVVKTKPRKPKVHGWAVL